MVQGVGGGGCVMNSLETHATGVSWTLASAAVPRPPAHQPPSLRQVQLAGIPGLRPGTPSSCPGAHNCSSWSSRTSSCSCRWGRGVEGHPFLPTKPAAAWSTSPMQAPGTQCSHAMCMHHKARSLPSLPSFPEQRPPTAAWTEQDVEVVLSEPSCGAAHSRGPRATSREGEQA